MTDKKLSEEIGLAVNQFNSTVLLDPCLASERLFQKHAEIMTTHQCDVNVAFVNKLTNG